MNNENVLNTHKINRKIHLPYNTHKMTEKTSNSIYKQTKRSAKYTINREFLQLIIKAKTKREKNYRSNNYTS